MIVDPNCRFTLPTNPVKEQANVNVDDILDSEVPIDFSKHDRLDLIFMRQHELLKKYLPIERDNGLLICEDVPIDIDDRTGQARLKDFFWRVTEELTEAVDAARVHGHIPNHAFEEMADALHFLVEACILSSITVDSFPNLKWDATTQSYEADDDCKLAVLYRKQTNWKSLERAKHATLETYVYEIIHAIGCASNCLKNRPWKQTHQKTDWPRYREWMLTAFAWMIQTFRYLGMNPDEIFAIYWKKSEVNKFRQRSNY